MKTNLEILYAARVAIIDAIENYGQAAGLANAERALALLNFYLQDEVTYGND